MNAPRSSRFGEPVELPWWMVPIAGLPALACIAALIVTAPLWARLAVESASLTMIWIAIWVARRVASRNMQSVWISAAYAVWFFVVVTWVTAAKSHG